MHRPTRMFDVRNASFPRRHSKGMPMLQMHSRQRLFAFTAIGAVALASVLSHAAPGVAATPGIIYGKVVDNRNAGVANASITLTAPTGRYRTQTNGKGEFSIVGVSADTYTLIVRKNAKIEMNAPGIAVASDQITDLGAIPIQ
jgi:hypothetical protein